jgi:heme-degrading monooxygenase HmoA
MRALLAATALALPLPAATQQMSGATVVIMLEVEEGRATREALASLQPILNHIRRQDGLLGDRLLQNGSDASSYVHVMEWISQDAWESLYEDQEFLDLLTEMSPGFESGTGEVYTPTFR